MTGSSTHFRLKAAIAIFALWGFVFIGCGGSGDGGDDTAPTRSFAMGFTPWPYEATLAAVGDTYDKIQTHGDIIVHHLDAGVPWPEAFADSATYSVDFEGDVALRLANNSAGLPVCLSVCPLSTQRDAPADYWGTSKEMARPTPWNSYDFGDSQLAVAYTNYLLNLIDRFNPAYCNYGIEATEYIINNPSQAEELLDFLKDVYDAIKLVHPDLPLFISVTLQEPGSTRALLVQSYASRIAACTDLIGASTYGYIFFDSPDGNPANLPANWLSQALDYAPGKPLVVAETGWIAEDLDIPAYDDHDALFISSTPSWQADYVRILLAEANRLDAVWVTWYCVVDFDTLWQETLGQDPLAQIWRDTGLYDGNVQPRSALSVWDAWLDRPLN